MTEYAMRRSVEGSFDSVVAETIEALEAEGFGVLCDIDVRATLREKLDAEFRDYRILGACNPELAHGAMEEELDLGVLLPCNVIVYEDGGEVTVGAVSPPRLLSVVGNEDLDPVAAEVESRFERVLDSVAASYP